MALQDLTPRLRTRLGRIERLVALFVIGAVLALVAGLSFYLYKTSERRGWFVRKVPYFTFVRTATGLKVGDPVKLMGFNAGAITTIDPQPADDRYFDVFIGFEIREPYEGYLWENSYAKIIPGDLLGNRFIEVTKGTNGVPTYVFNDLEEMTAAQAANVVMTNFLFGQDVWKETKTNPVVRAFELVTTEALERLNREGITNKLVFIDISDPTGRSADGIWDFQAGRYRPLKKKEKGYFLVPLESISVGERLETLANTVEAALPNVLDLTNHLQRLLIRATDAAGRADQLLTEAQPTLRHLDQITGNLTNSQGALGEWLFSREFTAQLTQTLASANGVLTNTDARLAGLSTELSDALRGVDDTLENLAKITGNLRDQVNANTNVVGDLSQLILDADTFVQGLKRHWLLRSAFKEPPVKPAPGEKPFQPFQSPKAMER